MLFKTDKKNLKFVWEGRGGRNRATDREGRGGRGKSNPRGERTQKKASKIVKTLLLLFKMFIQEFFNILHFTIFFMDRYCVRITVIFFKGTLKSFLS
jgi:hypothetical protein